MSTRRATGEARFQVPLRVRDLSLSGAQLVLNAAPETGSLHEFMIDLAGQPFLASARVMRCQPLAKGPGYEVGVEFVEVAPRDQQRLKDYVEGRLPRT